MILVAYPHKPFQYTAKNTPRRQAIIRDYETEIDAAYRAVDETTQTSASYPKEWTSDSVLLFVREVVGNVLQTQRLDDGEDIFQNGCDR